MSVDTRIAQLRKPGGSPAGIISLLLVAIMALTGLFPFGISACTSDKNQMLREKDEQIKVIATVFASYDFARQIAGPHADVKLLVPPGMEIHAYEPTPQDMLDISSCDLFIYTGGLTLRIRNSTKER